MISAIRTFLHGRIPGQIVIQLTDRCNAQCPQCGMRASAPFRRSKLDGTEVRRILDHAGKIGVKAVSFTGGEPFLYFKDLLEYIRYAGRSGIPYIRTGTNGFIFKNADRSDFDAGIHRMAESLARTPLRNFWISIDAASPRMHEAMRGFPGIIRGIAKALPIFHSYGIYPSANLGINRNMSGDSLGPLSGGVKPCLEMAESFLQDARTAFRKFFRFVRDLGFTTVNACYPMSTTS